MNRKEGYDQPRSVTTENTDLIEELICSQEALHTHLAPWIIAKQTGISRLSNGRMIKKKLLSIHKGKNSRMNDGCRTIELTEKIECNTHMIEKTTWQDCKDFTLDVPVNLKKWPGI